MTDATGQLFDDAIDTMRQALTSHEDKACDGCFNLLAMTLEQITRNPQEEGYYLEKWADDMKLRKLKNNCTDCHPPAWNM